MIHGATAVFSECESHLDLHGPNCASPYCPGRKYRYSLRLPTGRSDRRTVLFVMANPSTATPEHLDPTVSRCERYAWAWGYGWLSVCNVRAWRATNPNDVPEGERGIGPENMHYLKREIIAADFVVCAWGNLGADLGGAVVEEILKVKTPYCLRQNKNGAPAHPLYLPRNLKPRAMSCCIEPGSREDGTWCVGNDPRVPADDEDDLYYDKDGGLRHPDCLAAEVKRG